MDDMADKREIYDISKTGMVVRLTIIETGRRWRLSACILRTPAVANELCRVLIGRPCYTYYVTQPDHSRILHVIPTPTGTADFE